MNGAEAWQNNRKRLGCLSLRSVFSQTDVMMPAHDKAAVDARCIPACA
jgi:hypothetical protein